MSAENTLVIEAVSVGYGRHIVLENIDLPPLAPGGIAALIGPNAAGKTTLLRAIARLHKARDGKMLLGGRDLLTLPAREHAAKVSYMPQALPQRVSLSVIESVMAALKASPTGPGQSLEDTHAAAAAVLDRLGIGHLAFSMLDALSGGQRQMVSLAQSICREPDILLLDEPTSALDPHHQISVMSAVRDIVREKGMIAIVVMHDLNLALDWGDTIVLISDSGVVAAGDPAQVLSPQNLATAYGIAARLETCSRGRLHVFVDEVVQP